MIFPLWLGLGASLGLAWAAARGGSVPVRRRLNAGLLALSAALLGSRAGFVGVHWPYYQAHPLEIPAVALGGLTWAGALAGGLLGLGLAAALTRASLGTLADALLPLALGVALAAWLGCWQAGCAYGRPAAAFWALRAPDEWGAVAGRVPVQPLGALLTLAAFALADLLGGGGARPGVASALALALLGGALAWLATLRGDPAPLWRGVRLDAWAGLAALALGLLALAAALISGRRASLRQAGVSEDNETTTA